MRNWILLLSLVSMGQPMAAQRGPQRPSVDSVYDRVRDRTTVTFGRFSYGLDVPIGAGVSAKELAFMVTYENSGRTQSLPDSVTLRFVGTGMQHLPWQFGGDRDLYLLLDDSMRSRTAPMRYDTVTISSNKMENVYFRIPATFLDAIARARSVEGAVGDHSFLLDDAQRTALLGFVQSHKRPE